MASRGAEEEGTHIQRWRRSPQHFLRRLFCCFCLCDEKEPLHEQEMINEDSLHQHADECGSGEREVIQITVEDLGIHNISFSLLDEDPVNPKDSIAHSTSSVSACRRVQKKKKVLKPLSSLLLQPKVQLASTPSDGEDAEEEEEEEEEEEGLLTPPTINLIPPTPSDVVDDDQFFDNNSDESMAHTSGSDGSCVAGEEGTYEKKLDSMETKDSAGLHFLEGTKTEEDEKESNEGRSDVLGEPTESMPSERGKKEKTKHSFSWSAFQVAPLHEYHKKRGFNTGINLLSFTEHNLDDPSNSYWSCSDMLKEELCLLSNMAMMDAFPHKKRPLTRSCSFGDTITASARFQAFTKTTDQCQEGKGVLRQRRKTVASFMPHSTDQNGNFPEKDVDIQVTKSLSELNTEEVCQWFTSIGLQKCLPFIREAKLCGADIASVDANTLAILHIVTLEDKEHLLSAIYNELHPPSTISQTLSSLTENLGPNNVEDFSTTLTAMTKSKSSPQVSCLSMNHRSLKLRNHSQNHMVQRNSQMIEITINASERIVHLRTPKETTVGKIMDSCFKMLGMTDKKTLLALKEKQDSPQELSPEQQIGTLLPSTSENRQLELHLCKRETTSAQNGPEVSNPWENGNKNAQGDQSAKEERIRELNQQVDSLQNVIFQVQEIHHDLVGFCTELKSMDTDVNLETLGAAELKKRLEMINSQLNDKRQSLQTLRDNINNPTAHKKKQLEVHLMEKMKINCQVFKKEISMVHLNRQATQLQNALQECLIKEKAQTKASTFGCLSRLVSPQSPAMLIAVHENQSHDGHYGFTCLYREGSGLEVAEVDNSNLCVEDRLVEVNGVSVVNSTLSELTDLLLQGPCAQIVVLRQPPPILTSPLFLQNSVSPDAEQTVSPERGVVTKDTPPQRKLMTI